VNLAFRLAVVLAPPRGPRGAHTLMVVGGSHVTKKVTDRVEPETDAAEDARLSRFFSRLFRSAWRAR
jgi:hypothetical protein